ncbi:Foldase protein prsA [Fructilactobacillus fructivorans]|uniref:peptidylprolyl isomerase n=1 Tax=Fructilactobacillus fructivorans TaxID=1614 RepID=UPI000704DD3D|nr:peptidylprolyl isomerase [Fructilactobacillus fructivorans]KRN13373.1 Foldase protein prsA [Fructilactobacillus fructivorans]
MKKKWLVGAAALLLSVSLVACGSSKTVATTSGGKITESQYYNSMKKTPQGKIVLQTMILNKVLNKEYGDKVKSSQVDDQFNQYKSQYGSQFKTLLSQQGLTEKSLKEQIKDNLLLKQAVIANTSFSDKDLQNQFKKYQPKVTVNEITTKNQGDAEKVISGLENGQKFSDLAKKYSTDANKKDGGKMAPFDNTDTSLDNNFKNAAFKLKNGEYTKEPVKTKAGYQVIQMVNHPSKGKYEDHKAELKDQLATERMSDNTVLHAVVSKVLKDGDVKIQDKDLQNILADYTSTPKAMK